jgi:hypothetical protein
VRYQSFLSGATTILSDAPKARRRSPYQLLDQWRSFVDDCINGYAWSWYDFDNERGVRDTIDRLMSDSDLREFPEWEVWSRKIKVLDDAYRSILVDIPNRSGGDLPWWRGGVPRQAESELAADVRKMFGVAIDVVGVD